jgi:hypothetical protein
VTAAIKRAPRAPSDLELRVENRRRELISEIVEHKKNSSRACAADAIDRAKARLTELGHIVKAGAIEDWANMHPDTKLRLDEWIAR